MTIRSFHIFTHSMPTPAADVALIHIREPRSDESQQQVSIIPGLNGFFSVSTLYAKSKNDVISVMESFLHNLDFCNDTLKVAIYSNCERIPVAEAAYIAHVTNYDVPIETECGKKVVGFDIDCVMLTGDDVGVALQNNRGAQARNYSQFWTGRPWDCLPGATD